MLSYYKSDSIPVKETDFWKEMQTNRIGNLLQGARLKAGIAQAEFAEKLDVRQNISDYERGNRRISDQWLRACPRRRILKLIVFPD
jgi:hypothetical protein